MNATRALNTLDKLPVSRWHWKTFWVLGFALQFNGILNSSGNSVIADLVDTGWSDNFLNASFSSAMMMGFFVGSLLAGALGDRIGRKLTYQLCILLFGVMALVAAMAPDMGFLIVCRGLMGIGMGGGIVLGYGSFTEFIPARVRGTWSARISLLGNLSPLIAAVLAAVLIPNLSWRAMFVVGGIGSLVMLVVVRRRLDESPRWLIKNGRVAEGIDIVDEAARVSGYQPSAEPDSALPQVEAEATTTQKVPVVDFFRGALGRRTLVATAALVAMNLSLYTITQWVPTIFVNQGIDIKSSLTMSMTMMIGAPIGVFISTLIIDKFPRRTLGPVLIMMVAILGFIYANQTTEAGILIAGTIMIVVLYIYNAFASAVYVPEIWPTGQKMRGLGIANSIGRIAAIFSPYLVAMLLTDFGVVAVFVVLGAMLAACALIVAVFGIETRGRTCEEMAVVLTKNA